MSQDILVVIEHLQGQVTELSYVLLAAGRALAQATGGSLKALLLGHHAEELATDLGADQVLYVDHPRLAEFTSDAYQEALAGLIKEKMPRAVLFGDTSIGADLAGVLSVRLELPLVSSCFDVRTENGRPTFVSRICGGKIIAEGELPTPTALVTMGPGGFKPEQGHAVGAPPVTPVATTALAEARITIRRFIEPEAGDVDISKEAILVAVGRGIQTADNLDLANELAEALGGAVCASRPVVDQGWLPTSRMVGKSGQVVKPKLYLAIGISGAPEHIEGIAGSETIIAINTDPMAPIFDVAHYGAEVDALDLMEMLIEQIEEARDG